MMFLNYPNNPTTVLADEGFFGEVVDFARENEILVCHDAAYTEIAFYGKKSPELPRDTGGGGRRNRVPLALKDLQHDRVAPSVRRGEARGAIAGLGKIKTNIDSGVFQAVQVAGITALRNSSLGLEERKEVYRGAPRDILPRAFRKRA